MAPGGSGYQWGTVHWTGAVAAVVETCSGVQDSVVTANGMPLKVCVTVDVALTNAVSIPCEMRRWWKALEPDIATGEPLWEVWRSDGLGEGCWSASRGQVDIVWSSTKIGPEVPCDGAYTLWLIYQSGSVAGKALTAGCWLACNGVLGETDEFCVFGDAPSIPLSPSVALNWPSGDFFRVCRDGFVTRHFFSLLRSWVSLYGISISLWDSARASRTYLTLGWSCLSESSWWLVWEAILPLCTAWQSTLSSSPIRLMESNSSSLWGAKKEADKSWTMSSNNDVWCRIG